ncbi:MAG: hypothetical protein NXI16_08815 [Alphaproteobacteria bacterium]|nr:hypothetical protein [Alphaproteobacteria bacterium]
MLNARCFAMAGLLALPLLAGAAQPTPAFAQAQQAGNEASTKADETFQKLIEQCDDTDVLVLRARIRLLVSRTTEEAATKAQEMMDQGMAQCGEGKIEDAKVTLAEAERIASEGATEKFGTTGTVESEDDTTEEAAETREEDAQEDKPWWKIWD